MGERSEFVAKLLREREEQRDAEIARGWRVPIYRGYHITLGPAYTRDTRWQFVHDDYDGADDSHDNRCGFGETPEACREEIDEIEEDRAERFAMRSAA